MQLAALSLRGLADPVSFIHSLKGDNRYIGDYLVDEVLSFISSDLLDFLLRTSILNQMETSLCNYVLQINNSQNCSSLLTNSACLLCLWMIIANGFRYHHLFREMLYARLVRKSPEIVEELYQRASNWHAEHEFKEDAVDYALEGRTTTGLRPL